MSLAEESFGRGRRRICPPGRAEVLLVVKDCLASFFGVEGSSFLSPSLVAVGGLGVPGLEGFGGFSKKGLRVQGPGFEEVAILGETS